MKTLNLCTLGLMCLLLVTACGSTSKKKDADSAPSWVSTGELKGYPTEMYLVGTGEGVTKDVANNAARSELLKTIRVRVRSELASTEEVQQRIRDNKMLETVDREIRRDIKATSDVEMDGLTIAESWMHPKTGIHYSFAVLDRQQAESRLRRDISDIDMEVMSLTSQAETDADSLKRIGYLIKAKRLLEKRKLLNEYLRVVSMTGQGQGTDFAQAQLDEKLNAIQSKLVLGVAASGDYADEIAGFASGELGEAGFRTAASTDADYVLNVKLALQQPFREKQWYWVRGKVDVVLNSKNNETRGSHSWQLKTSATDEATATQRAVEKVKTLFAQELAVVLLGFAERD